MKRPPFRQEHGDDLEYVRYLVLERLRTDRSYRSLTAPWLDLDFEDDSLRQHFDQLASEVLWQLLAEGVIAPLPFGTWGRPSPTDFRITTYGHKVLEAGQLVPHDPLRYLDALRAASGTVLTPTASTYVEEALGCFGAGRHLGATLLLGVAAESIFIALCEAVEPALTEAERKRFSAKRGAKERNDWLATKFRSLPRAAKKQLPESIDFMLSGLYDLIRRQRNDLGHPEKPPEVTREQAFAFFQLLIQYVRDAESVAAYCKENTLPS